MTTSWPLVGRERDLQLITAALRDRDVAGVVLAGPGGVGKTRLAREAMLLAARSGFATAHVLATAAAAEVPLGAFAPLLPAGDAAEVDVLRAARGSLAGMVGDASFLLMVDDAHLLDSVSATLLLQLAADPRIFVVVTVRTGVRPPDPVTALWKDAGAVRIEVAPLAEADAEHLLRRALGGPVAAACASALWKHSRGNPLALGELVHAAREAGTLFEDGGIWHLAGEPPVSERLAELIEDRLGALDDRERDALALVALGEPLRLPVVETLVAGDVLGRLDDRGVVVIEPDAAGDWIRPAHPLYSEVVVAGLGTLRRRRLLTTLADAYAYATSAGSSAADLLRVATWRLAAGDRSDPELLLRAAAAAYACTDYRLTAELAAAAWRAHRSAGAGHLFGFTLGRAGRAEEAEEVLAEATALASCDRERALVAMARAENLFRGLADLDGALRVTRAAEEQVSDEAWRGELEASRAMFVMMAGRPGEALELLGRQLARELGDRAFVKAAYAAGPALASDGRTAEALTLAAAALPVHEQVWACDLFQTEPGVHHVTAILAHAEAGELAQAEGYAALMLRTAVEQGVTYGIGFAALLGGAVAFRRGRVRTAGERCREAARAFADTGYVAQRRWALSGAALAEALVGHATAAADLLREVDRLADMTAVRFNEGLIEEARAWALLAAGRPVDARALASEAADRALAAQQRAVAAGLLHSLVRMGSAADAVERLVSLAPSLDGELTTLRAAHAVAAAKEDGAALDQVSRDLEAIGADLYAAESAGDAAHVHRRSGAARRATWAARRSAELAARCEGAVTPSLAAIREVAPLTRREREVALLAAQGLPSLEIAERLSLSRRTVDNHLQRAFAKLGISRRAELPDALRGDS